MSRTLNNYNNPSRGLGDTIAKFTRVTGIDTLARVGARAMGKKDCGCKKRQELLNKKYDINRYSISKSISNSK